VDNSREKPVGQADFGFWILDRGSWIAIFKVVKQKLIATHSGLERGGTVGTLWNGLRKLWGQTWDTSY